MKGTENAAVTVEEILVELADITSGAALVRGDDEQPRRGFRAALKEQMGKVGRHFQGAVTDVTTHTYVCFFIRSLAIHIMFLS